ncbi:MAG: LapA family protein [Parvularculaceae bacterium]
MKYIAYAINAVLAVALAAFLVANRQPVAISLDPVNADDPFLATPAAPLWVWLTLALLIGVGLGAGGMWASGRRKRETARANRLAVKELKRENEVLAARTSEPQTLAVSD